MAQFLKNLLFIIFHNAIIVFCWGIYELFTENYQIGVALVSSSILTLIVSGFIASYYHKQNIHVKKWGVIAGIITACSFLLFLVISKYF